MFSRLKQLYRYIFLKFNKNSEIEIKKILTEEEFNLFSKMKNYDKLHSFLIYRKIKEDKILKGDIKYYKLALLHDIGKGEVGLLRRIKKVIVGDNYLEQHPFIAYNRLKNINLEVAELCKIHHEKDVDENMRRFQKIDGE